MRLFRSPEFTLPLIAVPLVLHLLVIDLHYLHLVLIRGPFGRLVIVQLLRMTIPPCPAQAICV